MRDSFTLGGTLTSGGSNFYVFWGATSDTCAPTRIDEIFHTVHFGWFSKSSRGVFDRKMILQKKLQHCRRVKFASVKKVQSCVKTFLLSFENHSGSVPLPTPKLHYGSIFQPAIPKTWQECFYTTLYSGNLVSQETKKHILRTPSYLSWLYFALWPGK